MFERYHFPTIDSTNDYAKRNLASFDKKKISLVTAEVQSAGHGRFGRPWHSQPGNLYATFIYSSNQADQADLVQLLAKACAQMLSDYAIDAKIKWPNDLLVSQKKIAGILIEIVDNWIIMGLGLNINLDTSVLEVGQPITSMFTETGSTYDPEEVLQKLITHLNLE